MAYATSVSTHTTKTERTQPRSRKDKATAKPENGVVKKYRSHSRSLSRKRTSRFSLQQLTPPPIPTPSVAAWRDEVERERQFSSQLPVGGSGGASPSAEEVGASKSSHDLDLRLLDPAAAMRAYTELKLKLLRGASCDAQTWTSESSNASTISTITASDEAMIPGAERTGRGSLDESVAPTSPADSCALAGQQILSIREATSR